MMCYSKNPPPLLPFIERDLEQMLPELASVPFDSIEEFDLRVKLDRRPATVRKPCSERSLAWAPDCIADAWVGYGGPLIKKYWC